MPINLEWRQDPGTGRSPRDVFGEWRKPKPRNPLEWYRDQWINMTSEERAMEAASWFPFGTATKASGIAAKAIMPIAAMTGEKAAARLVELFADSIPSRTLKEFADFLKALPKASLKPVRDIERTRAISHMDSKWQEDIWRRSQKKYIGGGKWQEPEVDPFYLPGRRSQGKIRINPWDLSEYTLSHEVAHAGQSFPRTLMSGDLTVDQLALYDKAYKASKRLGLMDARGELLAPVMPDSFDTFGQAGDVIHYYSPMEIHADIMAGFRESMMSSEEYKELFWRTLRDAIRESEARLTEEGMEVIY